MIAAQGNSAMYILTAIYMTLNGEGYCWILVSSFRYEQFRKQNSEDYKMEPI